MSVNSIKPKWTLGCEFFESAVKTFACAVILDSAVGQLVTTQLIPRSFPLHRVEGQKNSSDNQWQCEILSLLPFRTPYYLIFPILFQWKLGSILPIVKLSLLIAKFLLGANLPQGSITSSRHLHPAPFFLNTISFQAVLPATFYLQHLQIIYKYSHLCTCSSDISPQLQRAY